MTTIGKRPGPAIADQLPKKTARILYNTLLQETMRTNSEHTSRYSEQNQQRQNISSEQIKVLLNVTKPEENSTWRIGIHKRIVNNL